MIRIIIVDDESITRQWMKKKIEKLGSNYLVGRGIRQWPPGAGVLQRT